MEKIICINEYKRKIYIKKIIEEEDICIKSCLFNEKEIILINQILKKMNCCITKRINYLSLMEECKKNKLCITYKDARNILNYKKIRNELNKKSYESFLKLKEL